MGKNLLEWEDFLEPFFDEINFVGEIPLSLPQIYQIGAELKIKLKGEPKKIQRFDVLAKYPRSYVAFLALMSAYNTEVDYWGNIQELMDIKAKAVFFNNDFHWGKVFLYILKMYNLETFEDEQFSNPYVTTIRLHGGIPAHSLPDFFDHIIKPYLNEPEYLSLTVEEFIPLILETPNAQYYVDKPVKYFLENLPGYAVNYVSECKRMAYDYDKDSDNFSPSNYVLPKYVVRTFQKYKENELLDDDRRRLKRPLLYLDPYQGGEIYLKFPAQEVTESEAQDYFFKWRITEFTLGKKEIIVDEPLKVRRIGYDLITKENTTEISSGIKNYEAAFIKISKNDQTDIEILRRWRFNLDQNDAPLIAFHGETGKFISNTDTLPSSNLWLIYPNTYDLLVKGGKPGVKFPPFSGVLSQFNLEEWDLAESDQVILVSNESGKKIPYLIERSIIEPVILGDNFFDRNQDPDSISVFIGKPPKVLIPRNQFKNSSKDLSHWELSINNKWSASPEISKDIRLADYEEVIEVQDDGYLLDLAEFLTGSVIGSYQLILHGSYGADSFLDFRVIPFLEIAGLEDFYLPNHPLYRDVSFLLCVSKDTSIELLDRSLQRSVKITKVDEDLFEISVKPDVEILEISIVRNLLEKSRKDIRVPLFIPIVRPSFKILLDQKAQTDDWSTVPVILSVDEVLQSEVASALIRFPTRKNISLRYRVDLDDFSKEKVIQSGSQLVDLEKSQIISHYKLDQFNSTIKRHKTSSSLSFVVKIFGKDHLLMDSFPILYLRRYLELEDFTMETLEPGVRITWKSKNRLENRRLRIWSLWKPWQPPIEISIPDSCDNYFETRKVGLPDSCYKVQFFTSAPWKEEPPSFYPPEKGFIIRTKSVKERLSELNRDVDKPLMEKFLDSFERACIYHSIGNTVKQKETIQTCWQLIACNKDNIDILKLLNFYQWLVDIDPYTRKALIYFLFKQEIYIQVHNLSERYSWAWDELVNIFVEVKIEKISNDIALLILDNVTDPLIRLKAFEVLVTKDYSQALAIILDEILSGQLSERAAISLIKKHPSINFRDLYTMSGEIPYLFSIIDQWAISEGWLIKLGDWVHCNAGWGQITRIKLPEENKDVDSFYHNLETPILHLNIRPDISNFHIVVELSSKEISFTADKIFVCLREGCPGCISSEMDEMKKHNDYCHDGVYVYFRMQPGAPVKLSNLKFSKAAPSNIWS